MINTKTSSFFRGIAILMVIASHYAGWMYVEPVHPIAKEFVSTWGVYGVDIFFLLSGYGLVKSASKNGIDKMFVLKRFLSSYLPYVLIVGFIEIIDQSLSDGQAVINLLTGYDYWYMYVLFVMYIIFMVFYKIDKFKEVLVSIGVIAFSIWLWSVGREDFWELSNGAFLIGIYAATIEKTKPDFFKKISLRIAIPVAGIAGTLIFNAVLKSVGGLWPEMIRSMFFTLAAFGIIINVKGFGVVLSSLGKYSLYIYLLHTYLFWKFVFINEDWAYAPSAMLAGAITLVISVAVGFAIDFNLSLIPKQIEKRKVAKEQ